MRPLGMGEPIRVWCAPCKDRGRLAIAERQIEGTPMCHECFRGAPSKGAPIALISPLLRKEKPMAKRIDEATRAAILKDGALGLSVEEVRKKHHVSWPSANAIMRGGNGQRHAGGAKMPRARKIAAKSNGSVTLNATPELCDGIWNALPLEKKAALLNRLSQP